MRLILTAPAATMDIFERFNPQQSEFFEATRLEVERLMGVSNPTVRITRMSIEVDFGAADKFDKTFVSNMIAAIGAAAARQGIWVATMDLPLLRTLAVSYAKAFLADEDKLSTIAGTPMPTTVLWAMFTALSSGSTQVELMLDVAERHWLQTRS